MEVHQAERLVIEGGGYKKTNNKTIQVILRPSSDKGEPESLLYLHTPTATTDITPGYTVVVNPDTS